MEEENIKAVTWNNVRNHLKDVNPHLSKIIDEINPNNKFPLYLMTYPYGSTIVNEGTFHIPLKNNITAPLQVSNLSPQIKEAFSYAGAGLPTGIVLKHTIHESISSSNHILPLGVVSPGSIFALWKKLDYSTLSHPIKMFTLTAGARFIFMLPNISDYSLHKNLKRDFNVRLPPPKKLADQWNIFKSIVDHSKYSWSTELLLFPKQWFDKNKEDIAWREFYLYLLEHAWKKSAYERNQMFYDLAFSHAQANRNLKPNPYLADTVKHIFMIAAGTIAGFKVMTDDMCGPVSFLQKIYMESYGLKTHIPTMLAPCHFSPFKNCNPVYYSLMLPTTLEFSPKSRKISSTLNDLLELKNLAQIFIEEIKSGSLNIEDTILGQIANNIGFDFFHSKPDRHQEIKLTQKMIQHDPNLISHIGNPGKNKFADSGTFVRGCVSLFHKNTK